MEIDPKKIFVVGHKNPDTDSICAAIAYAFFKAKEMNEEVVPARIGETNDETKFALKTFNTPAPQLISSFSGKRLILVDHNEYGQMLEDVKDAEVFEVIDHHKIGDLQTPNPILMRVEPVGSTSTIIAEMFFYHEAELPRNIAGLLLAGILSDTIVFKSPTTTKKDREVVNRLIKIVNVDPVQFGVELKKAGANLETKTAKEILNGDRKQFNMGKTVSIVQFECVDLTQLLARKKEILDEMKAIYNAEKMDLFAFMATDIMKEGTELFVVGKDAKNIVKDVFGKDLKGDSVWLDGVLSRKKQIVPPLQIYFTKK